MSRVSCPHCQAALNLPADHPPRVRCPRCKQVFEPGGGSPSSLVADLTEEPAPLVSPPPPPLPAPRPAPVIPRCACGYVGPLAVIQPMTAFGQNWFNFFLSVSCFVAFVTCVGAAQTPAFMGGPILLLGATLFISVIMLAALGHAFRCTAGVCPCCGKVLWQR